MALKETILGLGRSANGRVEVMRDVSKSYIAVRLLSFVARGLCSCFNLWRARTGLIIQGKPEWKVTVTNTCACAQSGIKLKCTGFQSTEKLDPSVLSKEGDICLLIGGNPLASQGSVSFSYAWYPPFLVAERVHPPWMLKHHVSDEER